MRRLLPLLVLAPVAIGIAGCQEPAARHAQLSGMQGWAEYDLSFAEETSAQTLTLGETSIRLPTDTFATFATLQGTSQRNGKEVTFLTALAAGNRVVRQSGCYNLECEMATITWGLDGMVFPGWGLLADYQEDGLLEVWRANQSNPSVGQRENVVFVVDHLGKEARINASRLVPAGPDLLPGVVSFRESADFPYEVHAAPGTRGEFHMVRKSLHLSDEPVAFRPAPVPQPGTRPPGIEMFAGEDEDLLGTGFSALAALAHLRNTSSQAKTTLDDGGCVVSYRVYTRGAVTIGGQAEQVEIVVMPVAGGTPDTYIFHSLETSVLAAPLFTSPTGPRPDDEFPFKGDCQQVRASASSTSATEFLQRARSLGLHHGGELAFDWYVSDMRGQKPLVPGASHFLLLMVPLGVDRNDSTTYTPYTLHMDADTGWWEHMTFDFADLALIDRQG